MSEPKVRRTITEIAAALDEIGSVYRDQYPAGWRHRDKRGPALVRELQAANMRGAARTPVRPRAHGRRGEPGTVVCEACGQRGQDVGAVCDACGAAVRS